MMRALPILVLAALLVGCVLALPTSASAGGWQVIDDCTADGKLDGPYSDRELRRAIDELPTDQLEYGDCKEIIAAAIGSGRQDDDAGGSDVADGSPGLSDPAEQAAQQGDRDALAAVTTSGNDDPIEIGGERVRPGENGLFDAASADNGLPLPLTLVLIALVAGALGTGLWLLRHRLPRRLLPR